MEKMAELEARLAELVAESKCIVPGI